MNMTSEQKIKWAILKHVTLWSKESPPQYPCPNVDALYDELVGRGGHWDALEEVRQSGVETGLPCDYSRYYESKAVAIQMPDKTWVGWTYWFGGGKHGEPGAIDWMSEAYEVDCHEEEKMVVVRTFKAKA